MIEKFCKEHKASERKLYRRIFQLQYQVDILVQVRSDFLLQIF